MDIGREGFEAVYGEIDPLVEQRALELFGKDASAAETAQ